MFNYFKKKAIIDRANDELLYEYVLNEIENGHMIKGLWAKALSDDCSSELKTQSIYMKYRVQSIKDIFTSREIAYNELTKANLFEYIQNKIFHDEKVNTNKVNQYEESIYNEVAEELKNNIKKEGLWLKALQNTNGDENQTLALYIKYRSESLTEEKTIVEQRIITEQNLRNKKLAEELEKKEKLEIKNQLIEDKENMMIGYKFIGLIIVVIILFFLIS